MRRHKLLSETLVDVTESFANPTIKFSTVLMIIDTDDKTCPDRHSISHLVRKQVAYMHLLKATSEILFTHYDYNSYFHFVFVPNERCKCYDVWSDNKLLESFISFNCKNIVQAAIEQATYPYRSLRTSKDFGL